MVHEYFWGRGYSLYNIYWFKVVIGRYRDGLNNSTGVYDVNAKWANQIFLPHSSQYLNHQVNIRHLRVVFISVTNYQAQTKGTKEGDSNRVFVNVIEIHNN